MGDPRLFKRPVRVTVPRILPTDDVLVVRERRAGDGTGGKKAAASSVSAVTAAANAASPYKATQTLDLIDASLFFSAVTGVSGRAASPKAHVAVVCSTLDQVRHIAAHAVELSGHVRAVLATFIPSALVALLSAAGIAALQLDAAGSKGLRDEKSLTLPAPSRWEGARGGLFVPNPKTKVALMWLASPLERAWADAGTARPAPKESAKERRA
jgi:aconitate hydratase